MTVQMKSWPTLYKTSPSSGAEAQWDISVIREDDNPTCIIRTVHGQVGGKLQTSRVEISVGKNIGRANETTPEQQAISEAESKWKKQLDKGYSTERGGQCMDYRAMLAHSYDDHRKKVNFTPGYSVCVQPKLDGQRALAFRKGDTIELVSRNNKQYAGLDHLREELLTVMRDGEVWDGELYIHGDGFESLSSWIHDPSQPDSNRVEYHVYDTIAPGRYSERHGDVYVRLREAKLPHVLNVETRGVKSHDEIIAYRKKCEDRGYEGCMVRANGCPYEAGQRSHNLLKVKEFKDAEFCVVDVVPGKGKFAKVGTFVCKTDSGTIFRATPEGKTATREEYLANKSRYIGKMLTVRFFCWTSTANSVPRFPVAVRIREDE